MYLLKNEKHLPIFIVKINEPTNFMYTIKRALGNMSERREFRFRNSLKSSTRYETLLKTGAENKENFEKLFYIHKKFLANLAN